MIKHKHHVIPKHMGGTDDPENIVELTVEEHAEAHRILFEKYGLKEDWLAWQGLSGMMGKEEIIKELLSYTHLGKPKSKQQREKIGRAHLGRKCSEETRKKIGEKSRGRKWTDEMKQKKSKQMMGNTLGKANIGNKSWSGKNHSDETRRKMRESQRKRRELEKQIQEKT